MSKFLTLGRKDFIKGLVVALLGAIAPALLLPDMSLKSIIIIILSTLSGYLAKNLVTNSNNELLKSEDNGLSK
jgi:hypothetical protein